MIITDMYTHCRKRQLFLITVLSHSQLNGCILWLQTHCFLVLIRNRKRETCPALKGRSVRKKPSLQKQQKVRLQIENELRGTDPNVWRHVL